jgi:hypothetical protein
MGEDEPMYEQWYRRWRLARALLDDGKRRRHWSRSFRCWKPNPRQINPLLLAVEAEIALGRAEEAPADRRPGQVRLGQADADFPP